MSRSTIVTLTLLLFIGVLLGIAAWAARRTYNAADFVLANRRLDIWLTALSYAGNAVNPWLLLMISVAAFRYGLAVVWMAGAFVTGAIVCLWFVAPRLRAVSLGEGSVTLTQVLSADAGDRFHPLVVRSAVFIVLVTLLLQIGAMLHAAGVFVIVDLGLNTGTVAAIAVALVSASIFAGGMRAAAVSDAAQTMLALCVVLFLPLPAMVAIGGREAFEAAFASLGPEATDWFGGKHGVVAVAFCAGLFGVGFAMPGQPHAMSRFMAARDEATLRWARWIALAWIIVQTSAATFCGWCAVMLYSGLDHPEQALSALATRPLPPWLAAVLVLMLLAAIVFSIGSLLLSLAVSFAVDLRRMGTALSIGWMRAATVVAGILTCCFVVYAPATLLERGMFGFTALGAALGPPLLVRLSGKRIRPGATLGAMWAGFVLSVLFHLLPDSPGDFLERVLPFIAALGIALTGGERRRNPDRADRSQETVHDRVPI